MEDDKDLVARIRSGDLDGLRVIYEKHKDDLLTVACCLTGERASGEDVLHDVIVKFAAEGAGLDVRLNVRGYLMACVANRSRDVVRRRRPQPLGPAQIEGLEARTPDPAEGLCDSEESHRLLRALSVLPCEQREVIVLHLNAGMTFKEVARHQGVSINTVQSRYRYGLDKLRSELDVEVNT